MVVPFIIVLSSNNLFLDCGLRNNPDAKLTANELELGDFPYHVGVYFKYKTKDTNDLKYVCGGSIITVRVVVTGNFVSAKN